MLHLSSKFLNNITSLLLTALMVHFKQVEEANKHLFRGLGKDLNLRLTQRPHSVVLLDQDGRVTVCNLDRSLAEQHVLCLTAKLSEEFLKDALRGHDFENFR